MSRLRIDFLGRYSEVSRILDAPRQGQTAQDLSSEFSRLIQEPAIKPLEQNNFLEKGPPSSKAVNLPARPEGFDMMARFDFTKPTLVPPVSYDAPSGGEEKSSLEPVKTPSLREARRIPANSDWSELPIGKRIHEVKKLVDKFGEQHGVNPALGLAVASAESTFNPNAVSQDGHESKGLFQLLDSTGKDLLKRAERKDRYDPFNPELNSDLGIGYLRRLHDIFGTDTELKENTKTWAAANSSSLEKLAVAAFNAGEGRVAAAQRMANRDGKNPRLFDDVAPYLPEITQKYVERVMTYKEQFKELFIG